MKRFASVLFAICYLFAILSGCGASAADPEPAVSPEHGRLHVVTTIFPEYDWVRQIAGDRVDLTLLLDKGVDLHSYQPTVDDMVTISQCDLFIYMGGESDEWVEDALKSAVDPNMAAINLLEALGDSVKEEAIVEGMEDEEEAEAGEEGPEYDEHVWLSLRNAAVLCQTISDKLSEMDPSNQAAYAANTAAYLERLNALDAEYQAAVDAAPVHTILFGDRFPFRYLADDYGLTYYAAFAGCSAETEASFETIIFLANKVDELGLSAIFQIESADGSIANTIRENTQARDQVILTMDSLQSATAADAQAGTTYLSVMEDNLKVLKQGLGA